MDVQVPPATGADPDRDPPNNGEPVGDAVAARSKENILQWIAYLPRACVRAMIKMGWDKTT